MDEEVELIQVPCSVCGRPIEITPARVAELQAAGTKVLCLEHYMEAHPTDFE
jgi:hypothetical protein